VPRIVPRPSPLGFADSPVADRNYLLGSGVSKIRMLAHSLGCAREAEVQGGRSMESGINSDVRELCKAVSEEEDSERMKALLDELLRVLEERQLLAALF
jgi:hypothetical protein